ncbi:hypothetical protein Pan97_21860 [Bremerella volcania]|uniref:Uncharacterized protein n=1 Tax=Bremerella volcania TaxID=2527984 RepID=A0A518C7J7_9BACT|nr:hypothetical protein [Bremerella volcania]QDU75162.1 hypothetical protein Pan97_21860 [Bremerella volcania]
MATVIEALGDKIKIDKAFVSGKDRISLNGQILFEGKLVDDEPQKFKAGSREYKISRSVVSKMTNATATELTIFENNAPVFSALYDQQGKPVNDQAEAKSNGAIQVCGVIGMMGGVAVVLVASRETGMLPGGAVGGAIGGGLGGAIGFGIGMLLFGRK